MKATRTRPTKRPTARPQPRVPAPLAAWPTFPAPLPRWYWPAMAAVTTAACLLRVLRLDHPMRYDEVYALLTFAASYSPSSWFHYTEPNNHVLYTLLEHLSGHVLGSGPAAVRLPALVAGVALVPAAGHLAYRLCGRPAAALVTGALVATSSLMVEYSVNARGYSMVCLAAVGMGLATLAIMRNTRSRRAWAAWVALAALGAFTIPIMVYPAGILALAIAVQAMIGPATRTERRAIFVRLAMAVIAAAGLTLGLYVPVFCVSGVAAVMSNRFVAGGSFGAAAAALPGIAQTTLVHWTRDASFLWQIAIAVGVALAAVRGARQPFAMLLLPPAAAALLVAAALAQRVVPFPRVWLFLLPLTLAVAAAGLVGELSAAAARWTNPRARRALAMAGAALCLAIVAHAGWAGAANPALVSEDPATLTDAEAIILDTEHDGIITVVVSQLPGGTPLLYYTGVHQCRYVRFLPSLGDCRRAFVVVGPTQNLRDILAADPGLEKLFGPVRLWRSYPQSRVYVADAPSARLWALRTPNSP